MGSKNLKSIVVRGTGKVAVKDREGLKKLTQWGAKTVRVNVAMAGLQKYGTAETVLAQQSVGELPTHNGDSGVFDEAKEISGERMYDTILRARGRGAQPGQAAEEVVQTADQWSLGWTACDRGSDGAGIGSLLRDGRLGQGDRNADRGIA
jgi:aldehyde:ferredoxin oxidoreductase